MTLMERARRKHQVLPAQGGGGISSDGKITSYITDDGMRLVNPDGPALAERIEALEADNARLREAVAEARLLIGEHGQKAELDAVTREGNLNKAWWLLDAALSSKQEQGE